MKGGMIDVDIIKTHWDEIIRLIASIRWGTVSASLMLRKLCNRPRQHNLAVALREIGRLERTLFMLEWLQKPELRRRTQVGLNKSEAVNALLRAVFHQRSGDLHDRSFEAQRHRISGLTIVTAAIVYWNTLCLDEIFGSMQADGKTLDPTLVPHVSPLAWDHINLTGDYIWPQNVGAIMPRTRIRPTVNVSTRS